MLDSPHVVLQTLRHTPLDEFAIIVYLGAFYILTVMTYRRPILGLAGLMFIEPFALYRDVGATTLTLPKIAIAAVVVGLLLRRAPVLALFEKPVKPLLLSAAAVVAATAITYVEAQYKAPVIRETLKAVEYLIVFSVAVLCFRMDPDERVLRWVFFSVALTVSVLAIAQEFSTAPAGMWIAHHAVPRIAGPLEGPNQLSGYLGLLLPVLIALTLKDRANVLELTIVGVVICADILTLSRAGVVSGFIAAGVTLYAMRKQSAKIYALGLALPLLVGLAAVLMIGGEISHFWSTDSQFQPSGLGTRAQLWEAAYRLWSQHPLFGIGAGNYELELGQVGFPGIHTHANSGYIQALVEGGLPLFAAVIVTTWLSIKTFAGRANGPLTAALLGATTGIAFHEAFDYLLFYPKVGVCFWLLLGVGAAALALPATAASSPQRTLIVESIERVEV